MLRRIHVVFIVMLLLAFALVLSILRHSISTAGGIDRKVVVVVVVAIAIVAVAVAVIVDRFVSSVEIISNRHLENQ